MDAINLIILLLQGFDADKIRTNILHRIKNYTAQDIQLLEIGIKHLQALTYNLTAMFLP